MNAPTLHLVSLDVPYPPDYGGAIDIFFKIEALRAIGVRVMLHAFQYGRPAARELESVCDSVHYYRRTKRLSPRLPYVVSSRGSRELLENLNRDRHPILFDGVHTCRHLGHPSLIGRRKWVRMHNVEWKYYRGLAGAADALFERAYFTWEALQLRRFERRLEAAAGLFAISHGDQKYFEARGLRAVHLPPFHANSGVSSLPGRGKYSLYHGNLSVPENVAAARFVIEHVLGGTDVRLVVAGRKPGPEVHEAAAAHPNVELVPDPSREQMDDLVRHAHVIILPTFQATGIKLKLIDSLHKGRFVIANGEMISGTGLEPLCVLGDRAGDMRDRIGELMEQDFPVSEIERRRHLLEEKFSNRRGAQVIVEMFRLRS
jgi:hypothetical protein